MKEDSIKYTGFSTPQDFYEWIVMLFGPKNAPRYFNEEWTMPLNIFVW